MHFKEKNDLVIKLFSTWVFYFGNLMLIQVTIMVFFRRNIHTK